MDELSALQKCEIEFPFIVWTPLYTDMQVFEAFLTALFGDVIYNDLENFVPKGYEGKGGNFSLFSRGRIRPSKEEILNCKLYTFAL